MIDEKNNNHNRIEINSDVSDPHTFLYRYFALLFNLFLCMCDTEIMEEGYSRMGQEREERNQIGYFSCSAFRLKLGVCCCAAVYSFDCFLD